jgi:hypothetical protein
MENSNTDLATQISKCDVKTLSSSELMKLINDIPQPTDSLGILPANLKDKLLRSMSKRGLLTDNNILKLLHRNLRVLDLTGSDVTDASLIYISKYCPELLKIDLNSIGKDPRTSVTSAGIVAVAHGCPMLQVVFLRRCTVINDEAVVALATHCPQLRELNLGGCVAVTDLSLQKLGESSKFLKSLDLSRTSITDDGVVNLVLGSCGQSLQEIHLGGCVRITDEAVEAVSQYCPQIKILLIHDCPLVTEQSRQLLDDLQHGEQKMKQITWTVY